MKKILCIFILSVMLILPLSVMAESIDYIDENGKTQTADCTVLTSADDLTLESGKWYAVKGEVTVTNRIENEAGDTDPAHLILVDGCKFSVPKGIHNPQGTGLVLYGQTEGSGECKIDSVGTDNAGIGGNRCENAGTVVINGGTVTVSGCDNGGACIGGGGARSSVLGTKGGNGGKITINGGTVTANAAGAYSCVGIGGGSSTWGGDSGEITINGGTVTAMGSYRTYAIGSGVANEPGKFPQAGDGKCGAVTVNSGHVTAKGYFGGSDGVITINDSESIDVDSAMIGANILIKNSTVRTPFIRASSKIAIIKSAVKAKGGSLEPADTEEPEGLWLWDMQGLSTDKGGEILIEDSTVTAAASGIRAGIGGDGEVKVTIIRSNVTSASQNGAGIGGDSGRNAGSITITDSVVTASSQIGAGIGGGDGGEGGNVQINGSTVIAFSSGVKTSSILRIGVGIGAGYSGTSHGSLSIDETAYEILSGSSSSQEYKSLKTYISAPDPYVLIHPIPTYTVRHSGKTLAGKGFETLKTEAKKGHAGAQTSAIPLTFEGFAFSRMDEAKPIATDGSTVVNVYYDRLSGTLIFNANGHGIMPDPVTAPFGTVIQKPADPKATGYVFGGWYEDKSCTKAYRFTTMPAGTKTVYAKWTPAPNYKIIKGANQSIKKTASSAVFASDAPFGKFVRLEVDGKTVSSEYYTAKSGSTVITLSKKYISTLKIGTHTLKIVSKDGSASTGFKVVSGSTPMTGDSSRPWVLLSLMLVSAVALLVTVPKRAKKKNG